MIDEALAAFAVRAFFYPEIKKFTKNPKIALFT
jgi:hypothetical protein